MAPENILILSLSIEHMIVIALHNTSQLWNGLDHHGPHLLRIASSKICPMPATFATRHVCQSFVQLVQEAIRAAATAQPFRTISTDGMPLKSQCRPVSKCDLRSVSVPNLGSVAWVC